MRTETIRPGPFTRARAGQIEDYVEDLSKVTSMTATYPIILDKTWAGWVISFDVNWITNGTLTFNGPITFNDTVEFNDEVTFREDTYFDGPFILTITNNYTIKFGDSIDLGDPPPGILLPPVILVNGKPTWTPAVGIYPWQQTLNGFWWWDGDEWTLQGLTHTGWRVYRDSATATYASGAGPATIPFDATRYDDEPYHDDAADNDTAFIPYDGRWAVGARIRATPPSGQNTWGRLSMVVNGADVIDEIEIYDNNDDKLYLDVGSSDWEFAAGDEVTVLFNQSNDLAADVDVAVAEFWGHRIK